MIMNTLFIDIYIITYHWYVFYWCNSEILINIFIYRDSITTWNIFIISILLASQRDDVFSKYLSVYVFDSCCNIAIIAKKYQKIIVKEGHFYMIKKKKKGKENDSEDKIIKKSKVVLYNNKKCSAVFFLLYSQKEKNFFYWMKISNCLSILNVISMPPCFLSFF